MFRIGAPLSPNMCGDEDRPNYSNGGELTLILELGGGELLSAAGCGVKGGGKGKGGRGGDGQRGNECGELHLFWILLLDRVLRFFRNSY